MAKFIIYLLESGLCLTLFYLGYVVFFRKETYFNFNRIYLVCSMVLSLLMPLSPLSVNFENGSYFSDSVKNVVQFRSYYEDMVLTAEPEYETTVTDKNKASFSGRNNRSPEKSTHQSSPINLLKTILYIYIAGLLFIVLRFVVLIYNLRRFISKNEKIEYGNYTLVLIKDEVPSFSFLRWVFVNKDALKPEEFEQVLAHEKVHVLHKHSVDLLLAHIITMFQWFNPLTWRLQKSLKTCHEYIADRQVLNQGHELFDYQSLLLSQLISIRSVELVNNFNLLSIKKRIAMMNKIKSGRIAKMKALLIVPMLMLAFFFFANMTEKTIFVTSEDKSGITEESTVNQNLNIDLPLAKEVKVFDKEMILCRFQFKGSDFYYNGTKHDINKVDDLVASIKLPSNKDIARKMSVLFEVDKHVTMGEVDKLKYALRNHDLLKIGFVAKSLNGKFKDQETALFVLLPPKEAKLMDEKLFKNLFVIKSSDSQKLGEVQNSLKEYIQSHEKYVMLYKYDNNTLFGDYLGATDAVWSTIFSLRRNYVSSKGQVYDELPNEEQKEIRKKYPITLTFRNLDMDEVESDEGKVRKIRYF